MKYCSVGSVDLVYLADWIFFCKTVNSLRIKKDLTAAVTEIAIYILWTLNEYAFGNSCLTAKNSGVVKINTIITVKRTNKKRKDLKYCPKHEKYLISQILGSESHQVTIFRYSTS